MAPDEATASFGSFHVEIRDLLFPTASQKQSSVVLQSLSAHTTEIDSLCFDVAEKSLISGSRGGSIKFWDMEAGKRTCPDFPSRLSCLLN